MPKKDHKAQKAKARQEAIRKQKATQAAQPRVLRQQPGLAEALSTRWPLLGYFANEDWAETHMASVYVIREAPSGQVFGGFLVDLLWVGTKDVFGSYAAVDVLGELQRRLRDRDSDVRMVPIAPETGVNLIRSGIEWARRWHYSLPDDLNLWLRLVDPAPSWGLDLTVFGENGERPIIMGTPEDVAHHEGWDLEDLEIAPDLASGYGTVIDAETVPLPPPAGAAPASGLWLPPGAAPPTGAAPARRLWLPGDRDE